MNEIPLSVAPFGFCSDCLQAILNGTKPVQAFHLSDGTTIIEAFCAERSVGALLHMRPGRPHRWKITVPIDAVEWQQSLGFVVECRELVIAEKKTMASADA